MAAFESTQECIWLHVLFKGIGYNITMKPTPIFCDNNVAIKLSEDPTLHFHVKHIDIKYHFLYKCVQSNKISIQYVNTKYNVADLFTKALPASCFTKLRALLSLQ